MKTIYITSNKLTTIFEQLQTELGGELHIKANEHTLALNSEFAKGFISGIAVEDAVTYIECDVIFKDDVSIINKLNDANRIFFGYCSRGQLMLRFGEYGKKSRLGQFQTGIFSNNSEKDLLMGFRRDEAVKISMITVDVDIVKDNELKLQLLNTFMPTDDTDTFTYVGSYNLKIAERIQHLSAVSQQGLVRNLLINGMVYMILALEIEQHVEDMVNAENRYGTLTRTEMEEVKEISEFIQNYPEIQYSLKYLSKKSGLSPFKLQEGFKIMHDRTVTDFIRNVRVEAAEKLIRNSDLNISEIVYTVGLTSRSYFSKIFKEKYDCSPKFYQNHQNTLAVTA